MSTAPSTTAPTPAPRATFKDYVDLARPFTLLAPFVGLLCGGLIAIGWTRAAGEGLPADAWLKVLLLAAAGGLMNAGSNAINQIYDLEIDRINKPSRPLPSGRLPLATAWLFTLVFYLQAWIVAAWIGVGPLIIVLIATFLSVFYSAPPLRFKNNGVVANVAMAVPRGLLLPVAGWLAVRPGDPFNEVPWAVGFVLFLFVVGAATTKDYADMEGDAAHGARTLPVLYGVRRSAQMIAPFFVLPYLAIIPLALSGILPRQTLPLALLGVWGAYVVWLILRDPEAMGTVENHPSWKHMYLLLMVSYVGFAAIFLRLPPGAVQ
ncbi:MAG TPA: UbiA family prenyltransferase [bacterium]|nr:UbiA family prenyltransferase [bacterium]